MQLLHRFSVGQSVFPHVGMTWYSQIGVPSPQESLESTSTQGAPCL